jgi:hypothetical protein
METDEKAAPADDGLMQHMPGWLNKFYADIKLQIDKVQDYKPLKNKFRQRMNYDLNLDSPRSYNEKIVWKKLYDRNPLLPLTADKYVVRSYLKQVLGREEAEKILIPLHFATDNPSEIPFDKLPDKFMIKPNHGSMMHMIVKGEKDTNGIIKECRKWLRHEYGLYNYEWAYRKIKKMILIEKLLESHLGELPNDYKFYCFHSRCKLIRATVNRFGKTVKAAYYDTHWNFIPVRVPGREIVSEFSKPACLDNMISLAEKLSQPFDYVRVDLFNIDDEKVYFGEFTHYEASGLSRFEPESFDFKLGAYWNIKPEYWSQLDNSSNPVKILNND